VPSDPLGILLIAGTHERAHYAFVLATAAAAIGRSVTVFATNDGCRALLEDWTTLADAGRDATLPPLGIATFADLRTAAVDLDIRLIACESGLRMAGLETAPLAETVEVAGVVTFLAAVGCGQIVTL